MICRNLHAHRQLYVKQTVMDAIQAFNRALKDADDQHHLLVKREKERFESEKAQIYERYQKMVDYDKCIDEFVRWWILMDLHCTQRISYGHGVELPSKIPSDILLKLKALRLKHPRILDCAPSIHTTHHWTVSPEKYHLLKVSPELEFFCSVYDMRLGVSGKPHRVVWSN